MQQYRVFINGKNFLVKFAGEAKKLGFFTTRLVQAPDAKTAEETAVQMLRDRKALRDVVLNDRDDPPLMHVEKIDVALLCDEPERPQPGLVWYAEDGSDLTQVEAAPGE
jgi:hypothetical protein